jgi:hypothetical protein
VEAPADHCAREIRLFDVILCGALAAAERQDVRHLIAERKEINHARFRTETQGSSPDDLC